MSIKASLIILLVGLALVGIGIPFLINNEVTSYRQDGQLMFNTEQEYSQFKQVIGNNEVEIIDVDALSSAPPIVVQYDVIYPSDYEFNYEGNKTTQNGKYTEIYLSLFVIGGILLLFAFDRGDKSDSGINTE
jgi:hypothetical protein